MCSKHLSRFSTSDFYFFRDSRTTYIGSCGNGCPVDRAFSFRPEGSGSWLALRNIVMYANSPSTCKARRECNVSKFQCKLYLWGYQSGGAISSVADQNCDGMS